MHIGEIPTWLSLGATAGVTVFALSRPDRELRIVAGLHLLMLINGFGNLVVAMRGLPIDLIQFTVCMAIALRSRRYWTLWASAGYLLSVVTAILYLTQLDMSPWAYASAELIWCYVATGAMLWGALTVRPAGRDATRRRSVSGVFAAWIYSARSALKTAPKSSASAAAISTTSISLAQGPSDSSGRARPRKTASESELLA